MVRAAPRRLSRTARRRVLMRAVAAWQASKPHTAWEILAQAGMAHYWPYLRRALLRANRERFERTMSRYT